MDAAIEFGADITYGDIRQEYEQMPPSWWPADYVSPKPRGTSLDRASTGNVSFSSHLILNEGAALRFNEMFCHGYEDLDFFERAVSLGFKIIFVPEAVIIEKIPASRSTPARLIAFARSSAAAHVQAGILRKGYRSSAIKFTIKGIRRILTSVVLIVLCYLGHLGDYAFFTRRYYKARTRLARGLGNLQGVFRRPALFYNVIDGD